MATARTTSTSAKATAKAANSEPSVDEHKTPFEVDNLEEDEAINEAAAEAAAAKTATTANTTPTWLLVPPQPLEPL